MGLASIFVVGALSLSLYTLADVLDPHPHHDIAYIDPREAPSVPEEVKAVYIELCLGITADHFNLTKGEPASEHKLFSSQLTFPNVENVYRDVFKEKDNQVSNLAKDAMLEMLKLPDGRRPGVMAAMIIDKKIYLSSAVKQGGISTSVENAAKLPKDLPKRWLKNCLTQCRSDNSPEVSAACAQCMVMLQFYQDNPDRQDCDGALFVAVKLGKDGEKDADKIEVLHPCSGPNNSTDVQLSRGCILATMATDTCNGKFIGEGQNKKDFDFYFMGKKVSIRGKPESDEEFKTKGKERYYEKGQVKIEKP